jgi:hypothetical protein
MKKFLTIFLISLGSLIVLIAAVASILLWIVFTPEKITPIIRKQAAHYINCETEIGKVELTFFSSFPNFELKINRLVLINPISNVPCDTLLNMAQFSGTVDIKALLKDELKIKNLRISDGALCAHINKAGKANFDIFPSDTTAIAEPSSEGFNILFKDIDLKNIELKNIKISYIDDASGMKIVTSGLSSKINGLLKTNYINAGIDLSPFDLSFEYGEEQSARIMGLSAKISGTMKSDLINANIILHPFNTFYTYKGEEFLQSTRLSLNTIASAVLSKQSINIDTLAASINDMSISLGGTVINDTVNKNIITNLHYNFGSWSIDSLIKLVPSSYASYLKGIEAGGKLSSEGMIKGVYNETTYPLFDIHLQFEESTLKYAQLPIPLKDINGDLRIYTDLKNNAESFVKINSFRAKTPKSSIKTAGVINRLFSDMHADLSTTATINLAEAESMIPSGLKLKMKGILSGDIKSNFSISQIQKMELEKIKLAGKLSLISVDATYDSLFIKTDLTNIDFTFPNPQPSINHATFAATKITSTSLEAKMTDIFNVSLQNALVTLETSDIRDTTKIPTLACNFSFDNLLANVDSINISAVNPKGSVGMAPQRRATERPRFNITYNSGIIQANTNEYSLGLDNIDLTATIIYNETEKDFFLRWMPIGSLNLSEGSVNMSSLSSPIEIPSVKMDFNPRTFTIEKAEVKINESDFHLSGKLNNILSYYRRDSTLRGDFLFTSNHTDLAQIIELTSGLGNPGEEKEKKETIANNSYSGPYMVPKRMDILLHTNIKNATWGKDTLANITGDVRAHDGILIMDNLTFSTPAANMQLTAMYQTPRKNHLFAALDLHMLEIEIHQLLKMIPQIDTLMPMLRSFAGTGEFHFAIQTNLDSLYRIKMSTILGAASIVGKDLVLMDGETFSEIAKKLWFSKKTQNKVDSLSAEFTVFRNEIDVYPFLIVMDKYKAVVGGRHHLDLSFDYNITIVQSPLPFRIALNVSGTADKLKFRLGKSKYPDFYRPVSQKIVGNKQLELRKMIRDALVKNVVHKE